MKPVYGAIICLFWVQIGFTQSLSEAIKSTPKPPAEKKWFESFSIRGYVQARYNRLLETNPNLGNEQGDRSWGKGGGLFLRRMRIIFFGQISKQVYFYIQPDFASSASSTNLHYGQLRDAYFDLGVDKKNEFRFRIGQSKIPYGFENMQSSQNRLPLDRNDALNSAISNERDIGAFFYWAPTKQRELFSSLVRDGLKGSGDYGVFAFGVYNGQTANRPEQNDKLHGLPGHRCDIAVGAPLNSAPNANSAPAPVQMNTAPATQNAPMMQSAPSTGGKVLINPPHGQPGHDCSVEVGKPLPVRQ